MPKTLILLAVLALTAPACGKKTGETTTEQSPGRAPVTLSGKVNNHGTSDTTGQGASITVMIEADDFYFSPTFIKATPGSTVKVEIANEGRATHTFTIDSLKIDATIETGKGTDASFNLPASGVVPFFCRFHAGSGMRGALYFVEGESGSTSPAPTYGY